MNNDISYKCDEKYVNKLINNDITITEPIPKPLQDIINKLEKCNKIGNWMDYDMYSDMLENQCKNGILNKKMTESLFNKLMKKYGGYT